jgi:nucleoside-diphosphate-sugar epimerase
MKALVTGANGFLGRKVVAELLRRGHSVRAMVRPATDLSDFDWPDAVEVVRADLRASRNLDAAFDDIDVLIHLAAAVTGGEDAQFAAAVVGTERLLDAMARSKTNRIVLASSFSVYDWRRARGTLDESTPVDASPGLYERDGYAVAKAWQERVVRERAGRHDWALTVLRPGFIWGRGNAYLACLGQRFGPVHLVFGPRTRIPLTHVDACATGFVLAAEDPRAIGETINLVDDDKVRIWTYLGDYIKHHERRGWRVPIPYFAAMTGVRVAHGLSKWIFRGKGKLPSLLVPCRFEARFKPLRYRNRKARDLLGWEFAGIYRDQLERTHGADAKFS